MSYVYLASPYSHQDPFIREDRYLRASQATAHLLKQGIAVYSPIVHCHELAKIADLPKDFTFWQNYNMAMLSRADKFMILRIEGYDTSVGVAAEKAFAEMKNIPVEYL